MDQVRELLAEKRWALLDIEFIRTSSRHFIHWSRMDLQTWNQTMILVNDTMNQIGNINIQSNIANDI